VKLLSLPLWNKSVYQYGIPKLEGLTLIYQCGNLPVRQTPFRVGYFKKGQFSVIPDSILQNALLLDLQQQLMVLEANIHI